MEGLMTLHEQWDKLLNNQTEETFDKFWDEYCQAEAKLYSYILKNKKKTLEGVYKELADQFKIDSVIFMGFLDGINSSLDKENDLGKFDENTQIKLKPDLEKLYYNMLKADAPHLYGLKEWDNVLTEERRKEITKEYKNSKTVRNTNKVGRNDPCPCGSGKKYKKCCGKNA